jgi:hypothetical protein
LWPISDSILPERRASRWKPGASANQRRPARKCERRWRTLACPALPCESSLDGGCGLLVSSCCARAMRQPCLARCIPWTGAVEQGQLVPAATFRVILEFPSFPHAANQPATGRSEAAFEAGSSGLIGAFGMSRRGGVTVAPCNAERGRDCWQEGMGLQQFNKFREASAPTNHC